MAEVAPPNEDTPAKDKLTAKEVDTSAETNTGGGCCSSTKRFFLYDNGRKDVQAFYFNQFGRSILFISFMFLSLGVLEFANQQVITLAASQ